jgi:GNAT superfamily N-acetyltransferase
MSTVKGAREGSAKAVIRQARFPEDYEAVLAIWREYIESPQTSLDYQGNEAEFAELPGKYAPPAGRLLLGKVGSDVAGCVAVRPVTAAICEMKKLYVRPAFRGGGLGLMLVKRAIAEARAAGYSEIRLDVLAEFAAAQRLYTTLGFLPAEPVAHNPTQGAKFLGLPLG